MSLNIVIDADVQTATAKIGKFVYTFKESFKEVEDTVKRTSSKVKQDTDQIGNSVKSFGKSSQNALTALSLTIQDLPFGFIGIQNNLPGIIQGFANMSAEAKTGTSITTQLSQALIGPGGLFLAFSALTAGLTIAVQKYGSLGGAIDALFGKQSKFYDQIVKLNKAYDEYNKEKRDTTDIQTQESASTDGLIQKVKSLLNIISDQNLSYNERNSALNRLKEINKDYFGELDLEKTKLSEVTALVNSYIDSIKQAAITKGFEDAIGETSVQLAKQVKLLNQLQEELDAVKRKPIKFIGRADQIDTREIDAAQERFDKQNKIVADLRSTLGLYNQEIDKSIKLQNQIQAPIDAANAKIEAQKEALKRSKKYWEDYRKSWEGIIDAVEELRKKTFAGFENEATYKAGLLQKQAAKNLQERAKATKEAEQAALRLAVLDAEQNVVIPDWAAGFKDLGPRLVEETNALYAVELMRNNFFDPMTDLFENFLNTGKFAFEDFGKSILKTINQVVAKMVASDIINLLASFMFPGAKGVIGGGSGIDRLFKFGLGSLSGGSVQAPSLSGIYGATTGRGEVNFVIRGTDLVGTLNRANQEISRVG